MVVSFGRLWVGRRIPPLAVSAQRQSTRIVRPLPPYAGRRSRLSFADIAGAGCVHGFPCLPGTAERRRPFVRGEVRNWLRAVRVLRLLILLLGLPFARHSTKIRKQPDPPVPRADNTSKWIPDARAFIVPYVVKRATHAATEPDLTPKTPQNVVVHSSRSKNGSRPAALRCREWRLDREGFLQHSRRILP
jgi:hypothetical protein